MANRCIPCAGASFITTHTVTLTVLLLLAVGRTYADSRKDELKTLVIFQPHLGRVGDITVISRTRSSTHTVESVITLAMAPVEFLISPVLNAHATMLFIT